MSLDQHAVSRIQEMLSAMQHIMAIPGKLDAGAIATDQGKTWAVERGFEIISEASRSIPKATKARYVNVPWRDIATIGNHLRHRYWTVDMTILWRTAHNDFPALRQALEDILLQDGSSRSP